MIPSVPMKMSKTKLRDCTPEGTTSARSARILPRGSCKTHGRRSQRPAAPPTTKTHPPISRRGRLTHRALFVAPIPSMILAPLCWRPHQAEPLLLRVRSDHGAPPGRRIRPRFPICPTRRSPRLSNRTSTHTCPLPPPSSNVPPPSSISRASVASPLPHYPSYSPLRPRVHPPTCSSRTVRIWTDLPSRATWDHVSRRRCRTSSCGTRDKR
jgi:hypothetical protein